jgi:hypothetical protein
VREGQERRMESVTLKADQYSLTFCFLLLQDSQACAVRCLLSGSTFGRVMVTIQSCRNESTSFRALAGELWQELWNSR